MPEPRHGGLSFSLSTAPRSASRTASAAIAIFDLMGEPEPLVDLLGPLPEPGDLKLIQMPGLDHVLVCRLDDRHIQIHTHAGPYVIEQVCAWFARAGIPRQDQRAWSGDDLLEYWLAAAPSPLAIDPLLAQKRNRDNLGTSIADIRLNRLLVPALVVAVGRPNAGKSSLLNALARRSVAVVSDQPGTTRDSVGALLELDGLAVRWLDLPGIRETDDPIEVESIRVAREWMGKADLVLHCDPARDPVPMEGIRPDLVVRTMADLPPAPTSGLSCSARTGQGLDELALAIRERLVPDDLLRDQARWELPLPSDRACEPPI